MTTGATRRVFVGMAPEPSLAAELSARAAQSLDPARWRVYDALDIHLTLCFLGAIEADRIEPLVEALHSALDGRSAPGLVIAGTGVFPDSGKVRALWAGVTGSAASMEVLGAIQRVAGVAIESCGLEWDERPGFAPHLTLARPRGNVAVPEEFRRLEFGQPWRPAEVCVFESTGGVGDRYPRRVAARLDRG